MTPAPVLIAGAGPTGLAAALFLADLGVASRIVDAAPEPSPTSKALAVNPRSLEFLEPGGVTGRVLAEARPVRSMQLRDTGRVIATIPVERLASRFPMVVIPQARTEALLTEALAERGVEPERSVAVETAVNVEGGVTVGLRHADGRLETVASTILFAADGAHSAVRHALDIGFPGDTLAAPWMLVDVTLDAPVTDTEGYVEFLTGHGMVFALAFTPERWRIITVGGDPLDHLPAGRHARTVHWRSEFRISHRIADRLNVGRVCLGGDAAHLHSPMGARGMNLGIEDAWVFAHLAKRALDEGTTAALDTYGRVRREADAGVVKRVRLGTLTVLGLGPFGALRGFLPRLAGSLPPARNAAMRLVAGLDHPVRLS
ncbi:NAD(P)/FAD-dependent oxidoreductase [soil metagenome]